MAKSAGSPAWTGRSGWRRLGVFWLTALSLMGIGLGSLAVLGPPTEPAGRETARAPGEARIEAPARREAPAQRAAEDQAGAAHTAIAKGAQYPIAGAGRGEPGPIEDPDPALLEPAGHDVATDAAVAEPDKPTSGPHLPRIAADGRAPMRFYAAGFDPSSRRPRVGVLLAGIGQNEADSNAAIRLLPGAISLAVPPDAASRGTGMARLLTTARATGHEYLLELPLEPEGYPLNDPGPSTLLTSLPAETNARNLHTVLSRLEGYAGATGVIGGMRGERLAGMADQMETVLSELAVRGLLYIDPRVERGHVSKTWGRHADLIVDEALGSEAIDGRLAALEQQARDTGSALGLVLRPTPVAVARISAWCVGLVDRGVALAPVSALVLAPSDAGVKLTERQP